jgi:hypothetical protein
VRSLQYSISLDGDYAMEQIDERVRLRGHAFERLGGLALKAFLVQSAARGAVRNCYAPFYVWENDLAITDFLVGPLFGGVVESFGRPTVVDRRVLEFAVVDPNVRPTVATFETAESDHGSQASSLFQTEGRHHRNATKLPGLLAACTFVDTQAWTITRVRLWAHDGSIAGVGPGAERFDVLRAVGPALGKITITTP